MSSFCVCVCVCVCVRVCVGRVVSTWVSSLYESGLCQRLYTGEWRRAAVCYMDDWTPSRLESMHSHVDTVRWPARLAVSVCNVLSNARPDAAKDKM